MQADYGLVPYLSFVKKLDGFSQAIPELILPSCSQNLPNISTLKAPPPRSSNQEVVDRKMAEIECMAVPFKLNKDIQQTEVLYAAARIDHLPVGDYTVNGNICVIFCGTCRYDISDQDMSCEPQSCVKLLLILCEYAGSLG